MPNCCDSHGEWERILNFPEANKLKEIGLRVNLGIIGSRFSKGTKLGVDAEIAHAALSEAAAAGRKVMLHVHVMSRAKTSADVSGTLGPFAAWFRGLPLVLRRCVSSINVGGGLDSRLNFSLADGSVEQCICAIRDVLGELADGRTIIFECGRYFVEDSGVACASVVERKTVQGTDWLLVDVGTNLLVPIPSSGFMIAQPFMNGVRKVFDVADGICSPAATIARGVSLPDCAKGARLFVLNCGAYTYSLAECFGTHIAPAYLLRRGSVHSMLSKGKAARIWRAMFSCSDDDGIASRADVPPELPLLVCGDCVLREFEPGDVEDIVQGLTPLSMSKYTERIPHPYGRADALAWLSEISANRLVGKLVWAVELMPHQKIIGAVELQCDPSSQTAKVMYWIGEEFQNRGFGRRVVGSVLRYGFDTLGLVYVTAEVHPDNLPSVSLLSRLGFIPSGTKRGEFERLALSPSDLRNVSRMGLTPPKDRAD